MDLVFPENRVNFNFCKREYFQRIPLVILQLIIL